MTSIFPPLNIDTTRLSFTLRCFNAATVRRPEFSTIILWFSTISRNATINSSSSTVIISSRFFCIYGKIFEPGVFTAVPSAIVFTVGSVVTLPFLNDSCIQFAPAGSTPITFIFGFRSFARVDTPVASPPPPIGTSIYSTSGSSLNISIAIVPCPVATARSSNGWINVYPSFSASSYAFAHASSYTSPYKTTSAP